MNCLKYSICIAMLLRNEAKTVCNVSVYMYISARDWLKDAGQHSRDEEDTRDSDKHQRQKKKRWHCVKHKQLTEVLQYYTPIKFPYQQGYWSVCHCQHPVSHSDRVDPELKANSRSWVWLKITRQCRIRSAAHTTTVSMSSSCSKNL